MTLNDELYSRLVNLYQDLDNKAIHELNARIILLLTEQISNEKTLCKVIEELENEKKSI
tara:strand:+ start:263 stop:439 length:177 start_codon:yes stop_codon:yes gene_type:complete